MQRNSDSTQNHTKLNLSTKVLDFHEEKIIEKEK
jgi:hypothetical protein